MKHLISILSLLIASSCSFDKSQEGTIVENNSIRVINVNSSGINNLNLSSIIKSIRLTPLETLESSLLSEISKIDIDDNLLFIQNQKDKIIYAFDMNGKFQYTIGCKGNGPTEIPNPECFSLNKKEKEVWLINNYSHIYKYDYHGKFLGKEPLEVFFKDFTITNDNYLYLHASKMLNYSQKTGESICWNLWVKNQNSHTFDTYFQYDSNVYPNGSTYFDTKTPFSVFNDSITYHYVFSDTIYSIARGELSPKYIIDFGKNKPTVKLGEIPGEQALNYLLADKDEALYIQDVIETSDFVKFRYLINKQMIDAFYFKKSNKVINGVLVNDILGGNINIIFTYNNRLIGFIEPSQIDLSSKKISYLDKETVIKLQELENDSNPILVELEII